MSRMGDLLTAHDLAGIDATDIESAGNVDRAQAGEPRAEFYGKPLFKSGPLYCRAGVVLSGTLSAVRALPCRAGRYRTGKSCLPEFITGFDRCESLEERSIAINGDHLARLGAIDPGARS